MYKVVLYFSFGTVYMTTDEQPDGEHQLFESLSEAERAGASTGVVYEAVKV